MATVYNIKIKTVSAFCAYKQKTVEKIIKDFLDNYKFPNGLGFENTEVVGNNDEQETKP